MAPFTSTSAGAKEAGQSSRAASIATHVPDSLWDVFAAQKITALLRSAGIRVNGAEPWDIRVRDRRFFRRTLLHGSVGAGESYMDGWWDCERLDELFARVQQAGLDARLPSAATTLLKAKDWALNRQSRRRSSQVARRHYDLGNDLFEAMLDPHMQYTCGYWKDAAKLDQAQEQKLDLIARKLYLQPGMRVLDLGSGFGGLARWLAREWGCEVVSYNISREQVEYARSICAGLPVRVEQADYRDAGRERQLFDRVAAIGLCEHIGRRNYAVLFDVVRSVLAPRGLFLLHAIGANRSWFSTDPWVDKYIFPNGVMPSIRRLGAAMENGWVMEDWHNFGPDYDRTLVAWWRNFDAAWPSLRDRYGDRFYRMWKYYLLACAGAFRARSLQLWQIVLSKGDIRSYESVR